MYGIMLCYFIFVINEFSKEWLSMTNSIFLELGGRLNGHCPSVIRNIGRILYTCETLLST